MEPVLPGISGVTSTSFSLSSAKGALRPGRGSGSGGIHHLLTTLGDAFHAMRCFVSLLLPWLLGALLGPAAQAGAWARAPGEAFLSFSSNLQADADTLASGLADASRYDSLYLEVGLGRRLTFGAEYGHGDFTREA